MLNVNSNNVDNTLVYKDVGYIMQHVDCKTIADGVSTCVIAPNESRTMISSWEKSSFGREISQQPSHHDIILDLLLH